MQAVIVPKEAVAADESSSPKPIIKITFQYLIALFALMVILGELHEQSHITVGRIVCGAYGPRDFNVWSTADGCASSLRMLASGAGPLFSYSVIWAGVWLLAKAKSLEYRSLGFSLIFAPLPFARIFTALMGGGDEKVFINRLLENQISLPNAKIFAAAVVLLVCLPPIVFAWHKLGNRFRALYVAAFCVLSLVVLGFYVLTFLNDLLKRGFLADAVLFGTPTLVLVHFLLMTLALVFFGRNLFELFRKRAAENLPD